MRQKIQFAIYGMIALVSIISIALAYVPVDIGSSNDEIVDDTMPIPMVPEDYTLPESPLIYLRTYTENDHKWLQLNIYFEARNQAFKGMLAVGFVTQNRVKDERYPSTYEAVVTKAVMKDGYPVRHKCHFSWYCDGLSDKPDLSRKAEREAWEDAGIAATIVLEGNYQDFTNGALYYHTDAVSPTWAIPSYVTQVAKLDKHIYYIRNE